MSELEKGLALHKQGRPQLAEEHYIKALSENFDDDEALYYLGVLNVQNKKIGLAAQLFSRSLTINPARFGGWVNLGSCFNVINKQKDARVCWEKALTIKGRHSDEYADVFNNFTMQYVNSGNPSEGLPYINKALELRPDHPDANWNKALLNLELGNYKEGFEGYKWGFKTGGRPDRNYGDNITVWDGSHGKNIIVWGEQGIGDEIMFSSMIPDLQKVSGKIVFDCHPRLVTIFKESFPSIHVYGTRKDSAITWIHDHPDMNAKIAIGDLGQYFRKSNTDFPEHNGYLKANPERIEHFKNKLSKLGTRMKVGISWTGGYAKTRKDYRSIGLELWKPILEQDADFISMQYTPDAYSTISEIEDKFDIKIQHYPFVVNADDYHETASFVSALDLVITINTTLHHISGALGKECWTLTPQAKAWRYYSPDTESKIIPWYPSVKQYQQKELFDWQPVIEQVANDLRVKIEG